MKHIRNKTLLAIAVTTALLVVGCAKEPLGDASHNIPTGEQVEVTLSLRPEMLAVPFVSPAVAATKVADKQSGGIAIEQVDEPQTRAADDATVSNIWIFQFNGAADYAPLVSKIYREKITPDMRFMLKAGVDQRVVVLANSFDKTLANALNSALTYASLKELVYPAGGKIIGEGDIPMSGNVVGNVTIGTILTVPLVRTFAKVTLKVKLGTGMSATQSGWKIEAFNVAPAYWLQDATGDFPAVEKLTGDIQLLSQDVTLNTSSAYTLTIYLPANRRGEVDGTSAFDRKTNAPWGATYIKVSRRFTDATTLMRANYYIHLGANQGTDYNLQGNTHYPIQATLLTTTASDSRSEYGQMDITDLQYAGRFGGELVKYDGVWQFTKELWVQKTDQASSVQWTPSTPDSTPRNSIDGKGNTLTIMKSGNQYVAAKSCFDKNTGLTAATTTIDDPNYQWFLPAQKQLIGVWMAHSFFTDSFGRYYYWTSTEYNMYNQWAIGFHYGSLGLSVKDHVAGNYVRCAKEL